MGHSGKVWAGPARMHSASDPGYRRAVPSKAYSLSWSNTADDKTVDCGPQYSIYSIRIASAVLVRPHWPQFMKCEVRHGKDRRFRACVLAADWFLWEGWGLPEATVGHKDWYRHGCWHQMDHCWHPAVLDCWGSSNLGRLPHPRVGISGAARASWNGSNKQQWNIMNNATVWTNSPKPSPADCQLETLLLLHECLECLEKAVWTVYSR